MNRQQRIVYADIFHERQRQDRLKEQGRFTHTCADDIPDGDKMIILAEELGEVARAIHDNEGVDQLYNELVQIAAIAMAWGESLVELAD